MTLTKIDVTGERRTLTEAEITERDLDKLNREQKTRARADAGIKQECESRIVATYPLTRQHNITSDWLAGNNQQVFIDMRTFINNLRQASNILESDAALLSYDNFLALDIKDDSHWI